MSVAWALVPFAVLVLTFVLFGIRSRLDALLAEQHDATKLINGLRNDVRKSLDRLPAEPGEPH